MRVDNAAGSGDRRRPRVHLSPPSSPPSPMRGWVNMGSPSLSLGSREMYEDCSVSSYVCDEKYRNFDTIIVYCAKLQRNTTRRQAPKT
uniref:Uncharacterized protein n=1 Tax=Caenorhabditis japonica TaxID=281687 RepID=A0A8R1IJL9_CAEJA